MGKKYFTKDFIQFFDELKNNNSKEWFDLNRTRYEEQVKKPFDRLISDLLKEVNLLSPEINLPHGKCIFRINRDIRFSKDKTLYKTNRSAFISRFGTKNKSYPGMYFEINTEGVNIFGGLYMLDAKQVQSVREEIMDYHDQFKKVIGDQKFKKTMGQVMGEKAKRLPAEFNEVAEKEPLMWNKNWYVRKTIPVESILKDDFLQILVDHYNVLLPYNRFFERPLLELM